jgi:hypothetical protein
MSKALTARDRKFQGVPNVRAQQLIAAEQNAHFPSYFDNFSNFNSLLMLFPGARSRKRHLGEKREFALITAIMAIV